MPSPFSVVAIIAAYNEADIIGTVVGDLIEQGIDVYFLDDGSTDAHGAGSGTVSRPRRAGDRTSGAGRRSRRGRFDWERILRRKTDLAAELDAELVHPPRRRRIPREPLGAAVAEGRHPACRCPRLQRHRLRRASTSGRPTIVFPLEATSARRSRSARSWPPTTGCRSGAGRKPTRLDLTSSGGHEAKFPDRRIFPLRFILRHYPIRGQEHGERKVFQERRNRFLERERERGWHVQYDQLREGVSFLKDPVDADGVRCRRRPCRAGAASPWRRRTRDFARRTPATDRSPGDRDRPNAQ